MNKSLKEFRQELINSSSWILDNAKRCAAGLKPEPEIDFITGLPIAGQEYNEKILGDLLKAVTRLKLDYADDPEPFHIPTDGLTLLDQFNFVVTAYRAGTLTHSHAKRLCQPIEDAMDFTERKELMEYIKETNQ